MSLDVTVDIVLPAHNEEVDLEHSVRRLHSYLTEQFPLPWRLTVAENASTDRSWEIARRMADELDGVSAMHVDAKGRGGALRAAWLASTADLLVYMDVDLSTGLDALLPLVAPLMSGHSDLATGTRLAHGSRVVRGAKREAISRGYNLLLRLTLRSGSPTPSAVSRRFEPTSPAFSFRWWRTTSGSSTQSCSSSPNTTA